MISLEGSLAQGFIRLQVFLKAGIIYVIWDMVIMASFCESTGWFTWKYKCVASLGFHLESVEMHLL